MATFLNLDLDGRTPSKFIWKHIFFSSAWIIGVLVLFFRIDILLLNKSNIRIDWLEGALPIIVVLICGMLMLTQKWYYNLALLVYPLLAIAWFVPKAILSKGKIYLFLKYLSFVLDKITNYKQTILHFCLFTISILFLLIISDSWTRWFSIITIAYFYITFLFRYVRKSFSPAIIFDNYVETFIDELLQKGKQNESILISSFIVKVENNSKIEEIRIKNLTRLIMINYALETIVSRLNSFRGKRAYVISLVYEFFIFLLSSILFFWFVNYQLFLINSANFNSTGTLTGFEFLYYTIKSMFFSDIDSIKPLSWLSKSVEMFSYFIIAVLLLVIITSIIFSLRSEKINENIKLTTTLCEDQNRIVREYVINTYGKDIQSAAEEVVNIKQSLQKLKNIINKLF